MGLMVVHTRDDLPCTREQSATRALVSVATGMVPAVGFLIEPLAALIDERGRRLGDEAAGTQVIPASAYRGSGRGPGGGAPALRDLSLDAEWDPAMREAMREVDEITRRAR